MSSSAILYQQIRPLDAFCFCHLQMSFQEADQRFIIILNVASLKICEDFKL